ncbi:MAG: M3 family metallopeptidase [Candidatus Babeliales bacterium]
MNRETLYAFTQNRERVLGLFPTSVAEISARSTALIQTTQEAVNALIAIQNTERTFENTALALDTIKSNFSCGKTGIEVLVYVSPDTQLRAAARDAVVALQDAAIDLIFMNKKLFDVFKVYYEGNAQTENLSPEERYFLDQTMREYKKSGLDLSSAEREHIARLEKELAELSVTFAANINSDQSFIVATGEELVGVDAQVIEGLQQTDEGNYKVGVDYPTYFAVIEYCTVESTRKRLYKAFQNRAYPKNKEILNAIIKKRDQLAKLLGFASYAHLNIDNQMAQSPETAESFVTELLGKAGKKAEQEFAKLTSDLAPGVALSPQGKMYPWNNAYTSAYYKQKHFKFDEREISEYFPMQQTIERLLEIYETFFGLSMHQEIIDSLWVEGLTLITVKTKKDNQLLGYLILDLYPRANKYSHACEIGVVPALLTRDGSRVPAVCVVLTNFPKATESQPSLLQFDDVKTFFHEFGHAIHEILGATYLASQAGTSVKIDFVELPSQMLEEWLYDSAILEQVSGHYKTGLSLPEKHRQTIIALKNFDSGKFVQVQSSYALLSLYAYAQGESKDLDALRKEIHAQTIPSSEFDPDSHFYASFGHLDNYGARYYGYLWSKVFALDLFDHIKKNGLLNPEMGAHYKEKVLGKGGSNDPRELLKDFLGREPNQDAFLKDLGL